MVKVRRALSAGKGIFAARRNQIDMSEIFGAGILSRTALIGRGAPCKPGTGNRPYFGLLLQLCRTCNRRIVAVD